MSSLPEEFFASLEAKKIAETGQILWVSVSEQRLRLFVHRLQTAEYPVSTAKNGVGCRVNSYQTPTGLLRIAQKIGAGEPVGMIFKERRPTVLHASRSVLDADLILTRILWLEGLEPGVNQGGDVDTFSRYIYVHGTNQEELIGQPASHGCIRMRNADVLQLFDAVEVGSVVWVR
jgi:hypothetical protein